jgi:hypothetical protein
LPGRDGVIGGDETGEERGVGAVCVRGEEQEKMKNVREGAGGGQLNRGKMKVFIFFSL